MSRFLRVTLVACAAALVLPGCAAGFEPATSPSFKPNDAANYPVMGNTSPVALRGVFVLGPPAEEKPYAKGDDAAVYLSVVNQSPDADRLVSVDAPAAAEDATVTAPGGATRIDIPAPPVGQKVAAPVHIGQPPYSENTVTLTNLTKPLRNGSIVKMTFEFSRAGKMTLDVPVVPPTGGRETLSPAPAETPTATPTGNEATPTGDGATPTGTATTPSDTP